MLSQGEAKGQVTAVCTCVVCAPQDHRRTSGILPHYAPFHSLGTGSLIEPGARLEASKLSDPLVSTPLPLMLQAHVAMLI